jgi:hypothetical protein
MNVTEDIERMIVDRGHSEDMKKMAVAQGMLTLRQGGLQQVIMGKTSIEEILRVVAKRRLRLGFLRWSCTHGAARLRLAGAVPAGTPTPPAAGVGGFLGALPGFAPTRPRCVTLLRS